MKLNEAITELKEHGYLINEWKVTPDFDELSPEDKVTLTKAMNGAYTARKSGNAKNLAKYSAILNDIASKMKNASAIKKIQKMVGKMGPSDDTISAQTSAPKKSLKSVKLVTVQSYHFTGYKYETDWFSNLMSRSYNAAEKIVDRLKSEYNGSSVRNEINKTWRDDHDGEEGYYKVIITVPENNVKEVMDALKNADDLAEVKVSETKEVANNKEKAKTLPEIWYEKYKGKSVAFKILELRCFGQKYKNGEPTEYVIINKSGIKNSKIATIYKGSDRSSAEYGLYQAIYNNKFTNHTRQDAVREDIPYVYVSWLTKEGLTELIKSAKLHPDVIRLQDGSMDGTLITDIPQRYIYAFLKEFLKEV